MTSIPSCLLIMLHIHQVLNSPITKPDIAFVNTSEVSSIVEVHPIPDHIAIKLHDDIHISDHITKVVNVHVSTVTEDSKVHPNINLIPEVKNDDHLLAKHILEAKTAREKKAYPIISHVLIPTNIHYIPVQDLTVIPLRRESKPLFRSQVVNDYEHNVFQTYYGGYGTGLNFGGHGAGHGFYAYG